jgi:hypothetical protein
MLLVLTCFIGGLGSKLWNVFVGVMLAGTPASADAAAARKNQAGCGNKYAGATAAKSNLAGSACVPKADAPGSDFKVGATNTELVAATC